MKPARLGIASLASFLALSACRQPEPARSGPVEPAVAKPTPPAAEPARGFVHAALGKRVTGACPPNEQYTANGLASLVDGRIGEYGYQDPEWLGWWYDDKPFVVTVDLGAVIPIHTLGVHALSETAAWIFLPRKVEFEVSADGASFEKLPVVRPAKSDFDAEESEMKTLKLTGLSKSARYVRVSVERYGELPEWHLAHGGADGYEGQAWLFLDEILVNPK